MEQKLLNNLSLAELEELRKCLTTDGGAKLLLEEVDKRILYREDINIENFSSRRMPNYREENKERCLTLLDEISFDDLSFLYASFSARTVNRIPYLSLESLNVEGQSQNYHLSTLESFFAETYNVYCHEGVYNTYNYIKNYIYYLLLNSTIVTKKEVFEQFHDKHLMVSEHASDIANYLYEAKEGVDNVHLSIGNKCLYAALKRVDSKKPLTYYQKRFVDAMAFGISYENLENGNYEECKRLLFVPQKRK